MSTVRAYSNNKRISTGRVMKNGSFFQAYPNHHVFGSQDEWMNHWKSNASVSFLQDGKVVNPGSLSPTNQIVTVTLKTTKTTLTRTPQCCVCNGRIGQDHRMCVAEMYRSGIPDAANEWHIQSGVGAYETAPPVSSSKASTPPAKPTPTSPPPVPRKNKNNKNEESVDETLQGWDFKSMLKFVAPPGTYYIGDICYFLKDKLYDRIFGGNDYESGLYTRKSDGAFFMVDNTSWGDGCYTGSDGFEYGVDAGIIGIVSRSLGPEEDENVYGGKLYTFKEPVEIKFNKGLFRFKSNSKYLVIDTDGGRYNSDEDW